MKRQVTAWEKIFAKYIPDKGLASRMYKEISKVSNRKQDCGSGGIKRLVNSLPQANKYKTRKIFQNTTLARFRKLTKGKQQIKKHLFMKKMLEQWVRTAEVFSLHSPKPSVTENDSVYQRGDSHENQSISARRRWSGWEQTSSIVSKSTKQTEKMFSSASLAGVSRTPARNIMGKCWELESQGRVDQLSVYA